MAVDLLEEQRKAIFDALSKQGGFYDSGNSNTLMQSIMSQVQGGDQPFTDQVRQNMLADNSDASASGYNRSRDMINQAMANAGLAGSGLQASALFGAQSQQSMAARTGRREVNTRAQLENYSARERAQTQAMNFLAQQQQNAMQTTGMEVEQRGRMYAGGDANNVAAATGQPLPQAPQATTPALSAPVPARPTQYGLSNKGIVMNYSPSDPTNALATGANPRGVANTSLYQQQMQQQNSDRAYLSQLQADWDSRYGGR